VSNDLRRCVLCGSDRITTETERERVITSTCRACGGVVRVEFDPPEDPALRGRIEVLLDPRKKGRSARRTRGGSETVH
jgi:hypothetical protein